MYTAFTRWGILMLKRGMECGTWCRGGIAVGLVVMSIALPAAAVKGAMAAPVHQQTRVVGQVHVHIQGHITTLSRGQIKVRDRRNVIHMISLTSTTTYWHKLDQITYGALKIGMRVYVLGLPGKSGIITALKIHIYDTKPSKKASSATAP
jgi:hypothetical protein